LEEGPEKYSEKQIKDCHGDAKDHPSKNEEKSVAHYGMSIAIANNLTLDDTPV